MKNSKYYQFFFIKKESDEESSLLNKDDKQISLGLFYIYFLNFLKNIKK
jgi:hypothetical protein